MPDKQSIVGVIETTNKASNKRRWRSKAEKDYEVLEATIKR